MSYFRLNEMLKDIFEFTGGLLKMNIIVDKYIDNIRRFVNLTDKRNR
jgi:hypothetical protein